MNSLHVGLASVLLGICSNVIGADFFVSPSGSSEPPYSDWQTAATNIQDAVDAASASDTVWVTNGIYSTGGKAMAGDLTNRVALDKALTLRSVNGPGATIIRGQTETSTSTAVRCAWLTNGSVLSGFTLLGGGTRTAGDSITLRSGGGVWCADTTAIATNCVVSNCVALQRGGGVYSGTVYNSLITSNTANNYGGGTYLANVRNSRIVGNRAISLGGGGSYGGTLVNCALSGNSSTFGGGGGAYQSALTNCIVTANAVGGGAFGGGTFDCPTYNCIVWDNSYITPSPVAYASNYFTITSNIFFTCTAPPLPGNNITIDPLLVNDSHIATSSPCRGQGSALYTSGSDIDGEPWAGPPSMGCDEVYEAFLTGALMPVVNPDSGEVMTGRTITFISLTAGNISQLDWSFSDGMVMTNAGFRAPHKFTNEGDYTLQLTVYNTDNPTGVSSNYYFHASPLAQPVTTIGSKADGSLSLEFPSQLGAFYSVEYTTNIASPVMWQSRPSQPGSGHKLSATDYPTNENGFYRIRAQ